MKILVRSLFAATSVLALAACGNTSSASGKYPSQDVTMIVPYEAGGNGDTMARAISPCLSEESGVTFVVENVPGAGGTIGTQRLAESKPDGYTISMNANSPAVIAPVVTETGYAFEDLAVVAKTFSTPLLIWVSGKSDIKTFEDLANQPAGEVTIANPGANTLQELGTRALVEAGALDARVVPTDSNAEITRGVLAGDYTAGASSVSLEFLPRIESGEMRVLAVASDTVPSYLPADTPTLADLGYGDVLPSMSPDVPVLVPAETPEEIQSGLTELFETCLSKDEVKDGIGPFVPEVFESPDEMTAEYIALQKAIVELVG